MGKRFVAILGLVGLFVGIVGTSANAIPKAKTDMSIPAPSVSGSAGDRSTQQHGPGGHLPATRRNVALLSKLRLTETPGGIADVGYFRGHAYLAAWAPDCPNGGVHIVDVRNPRRPQKVAFASAGEHDYVGEGVHVFRASTENPLEGGPLFEGDILVVNHEACDSEAAEGVSLWDVSNPKRPEPLAQHFGDNDLGQPAWATTDAHSYHSAMGWAATVDGVRRAFVAATDNEDFTDVDIFDVTDPIRPRLVAETGIDDPEWADIVVDGFGSNAFHHDMDVRRLDGTWYMMVSYWDAGYVLLNVENPADPVLIDETDFGADDLFRNPSTGEPFDPAEGNGHQSEWNWSGNLFLGQDEDFAPFRIIELTVETVGNFAATAVGGAQSPNTLPDGVMDGPAVYGGYACPDSADPPLRSDYTDEELGLEEGEEAILVVQRGPVNDPSAPEGACFPGQKADRAMAAGWDAVLFVNHHNGENANPNVPFCGSGAFTQPVVGACTTHAAFHQLFGMPEDTTVPYPPEPNDEPDLGAIAPHEVSVTGTFDGWGYSRLYDAQTLEAIDAYAPAVTMRQENASGSGDLSVHEIATDRRRGVNFGYYAWYAGGLRVVKFNRRDGIREVGRFIDLKGNDFWGVQLWHRPNQRPLILMSDRDLGLYIFRYTGPG